MRYIDSWLTGLGLEYIIPKLKANGIKFERMSRRFVKFLINLFYKALLHQRSLLN